MNTEELRSLFQEKGKISRLEKRYSETENNYLFNLEFTGGDVVTFFADESGKILKSSRLISHETWLIRKNSETKTLTDREYATVMETYLELRKKESLKNKKTKSSKRSSVYYLELVSISSEVKPCAINSFIGNNTSTHKPNSARRYTR